MHTEPRSYDVLIVGGGPTGLAAGLFTARYGLRTLICDRGQSVLRQCAYLDNYLGFPGGIDANELLELGRAQALEAGCVIDRVRVVSVTRTTASRDRFTAETRNGARARAAHVIAASGHDLGYLDALNEPGLLANGELCESALDAHGRTAIHGLYVAGPFAGIESQALICAGQGARVALGLVRDIRAEQGLFDSLAAHLDWQVRQGTYDSARWAERVRAHFRAAERDLSPAESARRDAQIERWISAKRAQQLDRAELARRRQQRTRVLDRPASVPLAAATHAEAR